MEETFGGLSIDKIDEIEETTVGGRKKYVRIAVDKE